MASISKSDVATQQGTTGGQTTGQQPDIGSPISNDAYDVLTALQSKLEGLEAYRKYSKDGNVALWAELSKVDRECVDKLINELESLVKDGKFRARKAGSAKA